VEAEEIERALCRHPRVGDALVVREHDALGSAHVEAHAVDAGLHAGDYAGPLAGDESSPLTGDDVRRWLRGAVPAWVIPAAVHVVPRIALGRNGKPDPLATAALRSPDPGAAGRSASESRADHHRSEGRLPRAAGLARDVIAAVSELAAGRSIDRRQLLRSRARVARATTPAPRTRAPRLPARADRPIPLAQRPSPHRGP
jgi:AMP-binding enzyme C-terminal domain